MCLWVVGSTCYITKEDLKKRTLFVASWDIWEVSTTAHGYVVVHECVQKSGEMYTHLLHLGEHVSLICLFLSVCKHVLICLSVCVLEYHIPHRPTKRHTCADFIDTLPCSVHRWCKGVACRIFHSHGPLPRYWGGPWSVFPWSKCSSKFQLFLLQPSMSLTLDICSAWIKCSICMWIITTSTWLLLLSLQLQKWLLKTFPPCSVPGTWHDSRIQGREDTAVRCLMAPAPEMWAS